MKKVRCVLLLAMGLTLVPLTGVCGAAAAAPADPVSAAIAAAGQSSECGCEDGLSCSCACSPLAGSWVASLWPKEYEKDAVEVTGGKDGKDGKDTDGASKKARPTLKTFKFTPVNDKCDKFALNAQAVTRPQRVITAFPEVTDLTELVGIACKADSKEKEVNFTAIGFGVERGKEYDKTVFITVLSGTVALPDDGGKDTKYSADAGKDQGKDSGKDQGKDNGKDQDQSKCNEPEKLEAELTVAYFDAEQQDEDGDGFPDERAEPIVCLAFKAELKRVVLLPQCKPTKTTTVTATTGTAAADVAQ
jgi:hypothetical protein